MIDIVEIRAAIVSGRFTNDELNSIADAVKFARTQLTRTVARSLRPGDTVKFTSNKNGMTYQGTVEKIKLKYALVKTPLVCFNVPISMLEAV
jgi:tRNA(Ile2) C34 agmatinyltransferase TiaS